MTAVFVIAGIAVMMAAFSIAYYKRDIVELFVMGLIAPNKEGVSKTTTGRVFRPFPVIRDLKERFIFVETAAYEEAISGEPMRARYCCSEVLLPLQYHSE